VTVGEARDQIQDLLRTEQGEDGTYEAPSTEVAIGDLIAWRDAIDGSIAKAQSRAITALDQSMTFTPDQIRYLDTLARKRIRQLDKSIDTARANAAAGVRIKHAFVDQHFKERDALLDARFAFKVAGQEIVRHFRTKLGIEGGSE
jgi:hypothetical protein